MTEEEKNLLGLYLVNQSQRLDIEAAAASEYYLRHRDRRSAERLCEALRAKEAFQKFQHDLCSLLHI